MLPAPAKPGSHPRTRRSLRNSRSCRAAPWSATRASEQGVRARPPGKPFTRPAPQCSQAAGACRPDRAADSVGSADLCQRPRSSAEEGPDDRSRRSAPLRDRFAAWPHADSEIVPISIQGRIHDWHMHSCFGPARIRAGHTAQDQVRPGYRPRVPASPRPGADSPTGPTGPPARRPGRAGAEGIPASCRDS